MSNVYFAGSRLVNSHSMHETSSVLVDPVTRNVMTSQQAAPGWGSSDASRVVAKGLGINKGFIGQKNTFSVDCSKAGMNYLEMYYFETKQLAIQSDPVNCKHLMLFQHQSPQGGTCSWLEWMDPKCPVRRSWWNTWVTVSIMCPTSWRRKGSTSWWLNGATSTSPEARITSLSNGQNLHHQIQEHWTFVLPFYDPLIQYLPAPLFSFQAREGVHRSTLSLCASHFWILLHLLHSVIL